MATARLEAASSAVIVVACWGGGDSDSLLLRIVSRLPGGPTDRKRHRQQPRKTFRSGTDYLLWMFYSTTVV